MMPLSMRAAARLGQLIRLLGSDRPGEVIAAAGAINRTLTAAGIDLHALAETVERALTSSLPPPKHDDLDDGIDADNDVNLIERCLRHDHELDDREFGFLSNLSRLAGLYGDSFRLTPKQKKWLHDISARLEDDA